VLPLSSSVGVVEVMSSFCLAVGLLKSRIAGYINLMKILPLLLSPFIMLRNTAHLLDTYFVRVRKAEALQLSSLKVASF